QAERKVRSRKLANEAYNDVLDQTKDRQMAQFAWALTYFRMGGYDADRQVYLREIPPVQANISRCLTWLANAGLIEREYVNPNVDDPIAQTIGFSLKPCP